jgi:hypothetical protein
MTVLPPRAEVHPRLDIVNERDGGEIERAVSAFARAPNGGLIITASGLAFIHLNLIVKLATGCPLSTSNAPSLLPAA